MFGNYYPQQVQHPMQNPYQQRLNAYESNFQPNVEQLIRVNGIDGAKPLDVDGESEFLKAVNGKNTEAVWKIMDELMETVHILQPRVYDKVLHNINEL